MIYKKENLLELKSLEEKDSKVSNLILIQSTK